MLNPDDYMTSKEICELFGITKTTLYRWNMSDKLKPASKVGRCSYYRKADVYALIDPEAAEKDKADND